MLKLVKLGCERDNRLLFTDLSIELLPGQLLQIEGANGSGKTTLLRVLAGLSSDYLGDICWRGEKLARVYADFRFSTFYFGHKPAVKHELTPVENMHWRAGLRNEVRSAQQIRKALDQVDLTGFEEVPCGHLSAGQQRRVALADLSVTDARLWILDEPFTAIDVHGVAWLESVLLRHINDDGMVVITSHQRLRDISGQVRKIRLESFSGPADSDRFADDGGAFL